jgi:CBS domain-containing protein
MTIDTSISEIMSTSVITVDPDTDVGEIARLIWENDVSAIPVTERRKVIGMVTDYDLISRSSEFDGPMYLPFIDVYFQVPGTGDPEQLRRILATTARELMSYPVMSLRPTDSVQDAATIMYENRINAIPILDENDELVGIVSRADIVRMMASEEARYLAESREEIEKGPSSA